MRHLKHSSLSPVGDPRSTFRMERKADTERAKHGPKESSRSTTPRRPQNPTNPSRPTQHSSRGPPKNARQRDETRHRQTTSVSPRARHHISRTRRIASTLAAAFAPFHTSRPARERLRARILLLVTMTAPPAASPWRRPPQPPHPDRRTRRPARRRAHLARAGGSRASTTNEVTRRARQDDRSAARHPREQR